MMNFSCPVFRTTRASRPDSWKKLVFIWTPLLAKSGRMMPIFVIKSTVMEGFTTRSACICKSENNLFSTVKYLSPWLSDQPLFPISGQISLDNSHLRKQCCDLFRGRKPSAQFSRAKLDYAGLGSNLVKVKHH